MELKLFYMGELNGMTEADIAIADEFLSSREYAIAGTIDPDSGVRLSAMNTLMGSKLNELIFATDSKSQKVKNLKGNPSCELMFTDGNGQVQLTGTAEVFTDLETKKSVWQDWMAGHFEGGVEGDMLCVIKFKTVGVRAMLA